MIANPPHSDDTNDPAKKRPNQSVEDQNRASNKKLDTPQEKATQFDGNPNPAEDNDSGIFKPKDDTPARLRTKEGPKNP